MYKQNKNCLKLSFLILFIFIANLSNGSESSSVLKHQVIVDTDSCDVIILLDGKRISCEVINVNEEFVEYQSCGTSDKKLQSIAKKDIKEIVLSNGVSKNFRSELEAKNGITLTDISLISAFISTVALTFFLTNSLLPLAITAIIFGGIAIILGKGGHLKLLKHYSKAKSLPIISVIVGFLVLCISIIRFKRQ